MNTITNQIHTTTAVSKRLWIRRASSTVAVLAVAAAAIGVPVMTPEPTTGTNPVLAIARADCPPDCGGGPGNGGTPTGPPGGGTEFIPPSIPAMPPYEPGRGQPPLDQNNGISIYNSNTPQPSQAAQPSQAPVQNQDGTYNRAANGEQQPINHNAPNNQQLNQDWQNLSNQLNQQQSQGQSGQQSGQDNGQPEQTDDDNPTDTLDQCRSSIARLGIPVSEIGIPLVDNPTKLLQQLADQGKIPSECVQVQASSEIVCEGKMQNPHFSENAWREGQRLVDVKVEVSCKEPVREVTISMVVKRDFSYATNWSHSNPPDPGKEMGPINFTAFFECGTGRWQAWAVLTGVTVTGNVLAPISVGMREADIPACESKRGN